MRQFRVEVVTFPGSDELRAIFAVYVMRIKIFEAEISCHCRTGKVNVGVCLLVGDSIAGFVGYWETRYSLI